MLVEMEKRHGKVMRYVKQGEVQKLKSYLKKHRNLDVNSIQDEKKRTPLHIACLLSDDLVVRCLLKSGARCDLQDIDGNTPLHLVLNDVLLGNKSAYSDIAEPLIKRCPKSLRIKNNKNVKPSKLLRDVELEKQRKAAEEIQEQKQREQQAEQEWHEKLVGEWQDETSYEDYTHHFSEDNYHYDNADSYDDWADKISHEFWRNKNKRKLDEEEHTRRKKKHEENKQREFQEQLEREHAEYERRCSRQIQEQMHERKRKYIANCCRVFHVDNTTKLKYDDMPWPCVKGDVNEMIKVILWDVNQDDKKGYRRYIRVQQTTWHPDKIQQKLGHRLHDRHQERILNRVTELSQALNKLLDDSG
uniref:NF-kappa-B inhibitor-like protein 1 n=1 Tax=Saccoglossus kowalevskii TaxID=10224 RepID=A0ABM0M1X2_SACKO|nr:PREDICTED: NF-kappa-B inhibitor-like protein 1-like [Saccoglossus kowalevskii]